MDSRSPFEIFLGYPFNHKCYIIYDLNSKQKFISREVIFHETCFPYKIAFGPTPDYLLICLRWWHWELLSIIFHQTKVIIMFPTLDLFYSNLSLKVHLNYIKNHNSPASQTQSYSENSVFIPLSLSHTD